MFDYQTFEDTVILKFSKEFLQAPEIIKLLETLQIKELLLKSAMTDHDAMTLDDTLKESWWQENQQRFMDKIS
jgi:hypothetical protein